MKKSKVAIIGGKLQGLEVVYLAKKAGITSLIIDRNENVISRNLCDEFFCCDIREKSDELVEILKSADFVLPAIENDEVLEAITEICKKHNLKMAFDLESYKISTSKLLSDKLMHENNIPAPQYYPNCKAPYIVKPSVASGSDGVSYIETKEQVEAFLKSRPTEENWVVQEFLSGPSYSIEIIGVPGNYRTYEITQIHMDEVYDCKRVTAPCLLPVSVEKQFSDMAVKLAELVNLHGIMDVEVIEDQGILKVLEIDARVPSQTPIAVLHSSGVNLLTEIRDLFEYGKFSPLESIIVFGNGETRFASNGKTRFASFEHFKLSGKKLKTNGEHIIASGGPLNLIEGFCGADEVLTDYSEGKNISKNEGKKEWIGTFINSADSEEKLNKKRIMMFKEIEKIQGSPLEIEDLSPSLKVMS